MSERVKRVRKGILKQWPPLCPSGLCNENKGCVCIKRRSSAAKYYYDTVKIIYDNCSDIPETRPGEDKEIVEEHTEVTSDAMDEVNINIRELDLTCHETLDDVTARKRVRWDAISPARRNGLHKRWESYSTVVCITEDTELVVHDGSVVTGKVPLSGSCYVESEPKWNSFENSRYDDVHCDEAPLHSK